MKRQLVRLIPLPQDWRSILRCRRAADKNRLLQAVVGVFVALVLAVPAGAEVLPLTQTHSATDHYAAGSLAETPEEDPEATPQQGSQGAGDAHRAHPPGPDFTFAEHGPCAGMWRSVSRGSCTHADTMSSAEIENDDAIEVFDAEYLLDIAAPTASYCNTSTSNAVRVVYATTQNRANRYDDLLSTLRDKAQSVDYWVYKSARQTAGKRHVRYACTSAGNISVAQAILPNTADDSYSDMVTALRNAGYNNSNRKYLVFADWPANGNYCGLGDLYSDDRKGSGNSNNSGPTYSATYIRTCDAWAKVAFHELGHMLGAVQNSAPRHDSKNPGHPRDEKDPMAYGSNTFTANNCTQDVHEKRYDCNKNDYFHTDPAAGSYLADYWNIAFNKFLVGAGVLGGL